MIKALRTTLLASIGDCRLIIAVSGLLLSIGLHELFHVLVHWGDITSVHLLPGSFAIAEVIFTPSELYDMPTEELFAYGITVVTMLLTIKLVWEIQDAYDTRDFREIIIADSKEIADMSSPELLEFMHSKNII